MSDNDNQSDHREDIALDQRVAIEQVRIVFERTRPSNLLGPVVAALVCWLLWPLIDHALLLGWAALKTALTTYRSWIARRWEHDGDARAVHWAKRLDAALVADGLAYGCIATVLLPEQDQAYAAIMLATVVAIGSVGLVVAASRFRSMICFVVPLIVPVIAMQAVQSRPLSAFSAIALCVFLGLIVVEGRKASRFAIEMLRARYRLDEVARQREQALELVQRNSAVKDRFLATMSHEMRTPLHGMLGVARMLHQEVLPGTPAERHFTTLERTGEHLLAVINDVLDFTKIHSGHMRLDRKEFDLAALVTTVAEVAHATAHQKDLSLNVELPEGPLPWVCGDAARLRQVLLNLTGNAIKFTESGGITLTVDRDARGRTRFEVSDTGSGVAPWESETIFDAFHQGDSSDGRRHGGTGLGLTISRELARAMGGDLRHAPREGLGATFVLDVPLPEVAPPPVANAGDAVWMPPSLEGTVLLAEDNEVNALVAEAVLQRMGLRVDRVGDGEAAVCSFSERRPDLILMDWQMPGVDGFEATRRIRAYESERRQERVPIVALTANALEGDRERSLATGMDDHLAKPFRPEELAEVVRRWLSRPIQARRG